jgi:hypothetical protein
VFPDPAEALDPWVVALAEPLAATFAEADPVVET